MLQLQPEYKQSFFSVSWSSHLRKCYVHIPFQFTSYCSCAFLAKSIWVYFHFHKTLLFSFNKVNVCLDLATHFTTFHSLHFPWFLRASVRDGAKCSCNFATVIKITLKASVIPCCLHKDTFFQGYLFDLKHLCFVFSLEGDLAGLRILGWR